QTFVERTIDLPEIDLHGLDAQGELVVGGRPLDGGRYGLYTVTADGRRGRTIYADDTLDLSDVRVDPYTNLVVGASVEGKSPRWFDEDLAKQQAGLDETFPGEDPWIVDWSQDRSRFIVRTEQNNRAPAFYLYDAKAGTANQVARTYPALDRVELARRLPYAYKARDGVEIPGYLTRPLGVDGPAPLVLLPHRGPMERDVDGFDWFAHFLASRGYVVLQPNYRGSSGYGRGGHRGSRARLYRWRELWRLCGTRRRDVHAGAVSLRRRNQRHLRSARHAHALHRPQRRPQRRDDAVGTIDGSRRAALAEREARCGLACATRGASASAGAADSRARRCRRALRPEPGHGACAARCRQDRTTRRARRRGSLAVRCAHSPRSAESTRRVPRAAARQPLAPAVRR